MPPASPLPPARLPLALPVPTVPDLVEEELALLLVLPAALALLDEPLLLDEELDDPLLAELLLDPLPRLLADEPWFLLPLLLELLLLPSPLPPFWLLDEPWLVPVPPRSIAISYPLMQSGFS